MQPICLAGTCEPKASSCVCCTSTTLHHRAKHVHHALGAAVDAAASLAYAQGHATSADIIVDRLTFAAGSLQPLLQMRDKYISLATELSAVLTRAHSAAKRERDTQLPAATAPAPVAKQARTAGGGAGDGASHVRCLKAWNPTRQPPVSGWTFLSVTANEIYEVLGEDRGQTGWIDLKNGAGETGVTPFYCKENGVRGIPRFEWMPSAVSAPAAVSSDDESDADEPNSEPASRALDDDQLTSQVVDDVELTSQHAIAASLPRPTAARAAASSSTSLPRVYICANEIKPAAWQLTDQGYWQRLELGEILFWDGSTYTVSCGDGTPAQPVEIMEPDTSE